MAISLDQKDEILVFKITGNLDSFTANDLKKKFEDVFINFNNFVFDLSNMNNINSTGLGGIINCLKKCMDFKKNAIISGVKKDNEILFKISKIHNIVSIVDTVEDAILDLKKS